MLKVQRRGGFSERLGIKPGNNQIQLTELDDRTRAALYTNITMVFKSVYGNTLGHEDAVQSFIRFIYGEVFAKPIDHRKTFLIDACFDHIQETILKSDFDDALTMIESITQYLTGILRYHYETEKADIIELSFNDIFEREHVGYRFVNDQIVPISDKTEIKAIEEAINTSNKLVKEHLKKALNHLSDRENPDYENSIKESITAVEAICEQLTGAKKGEATLSKTLKKLESKGIAIHPALQDAFKSLYGYTSDAKGIRHAGNIGGPNATFEEAKFMHVSCCAFINYLTALQAKIK